MPVMDLQMMSLSYNDWMYLKIHITLSLLSISTVIYVSFEVYMFYVFIMFSLCFAWQISLWDNEVEVEKIILPQGSFSSFSGAFDHVPRSSLAVGVCSVVVRFNCFFSGLCWLKSCGSVLVLGNSKWEKSLTSRSIYSSCSGACDHLAWLPSADGVCPVVIEL